MNAAAAERKKLPKKCISRLLCDSGSEDSSSSDDEDWPSNSKLPAAATVQAQAKSRSPEPVAAPTTPEDEFDFSVLSLSGLWVNAPVSDNNSQEVQELPFQFSSCKGYAAAFKPLIVKECKAMLVGKREEENEGLVVSCQLSVSAQEAGPFRYLEAKCSPLNVEVGQVVLVEQSGIIKTIAVVSFLLRPSSSAVLSAPSSCNLTSGPYKLRVLDNLTTVKRSYVAVSHLSSFSDPVKQQILNPRPDTNSWLQDPRQCDEAISTWSSWQQRTSFNRQQLLAIIAVVRMQPGFFLVQGPPGTGKTTTIVGMVSAFLNENPSAKILLCAPSNAALDEACARLLKGMYNKAGETYIPDKGTVLRAGRKTKISSTSHGATVDAILSGQSLCSSWQEEEKSLYKYAAIVCATLSSSGHWLMDELDMTFDLVIIDEAAQAVEPETIIALRRAKRRCILIGDPCQLPATVFQQPECPYGRSLFERMQAAAVVPHLLDTQYRMHGDISSFPSRRFYHGALKDAAEVPDTESLFKQESVSWEGYRFKLEHYSFLNLDLGGVDVVDSNMSRFNRDEARAVAFIVRAIFSNLKAGVKVQVGIITPYSSQRQLIWNSLTEAERSWCEINTIDGFQGREKDIILVSCVRAQQGSGLGFVSDKRRMNVALTRAKCALFVVGHAETLGNESSEWKDLIQDARHRGLYQDVSKDQRQSKKSSKSRKGKRKNVEEAAV